MKNLTSELQKIYDIEIQLGNEVKRVDEPAGTHCPLAVVFKKPLHFSEINSKIALSADIERWSSSDPHYPRESGFYCKKTRQAIAGPN